MQRGAYLDDPAAGVLVCLVGDDGSTLLRRVAPVVDPHQVHEEVKRICADAELAPPGADCSIALDAAARLAASGAPPTRRFQEGAVDEISFLAPDLGPLAGLIIGTEGGTWLCEEVDVSSSRSGHTDRFVCRSEVGTAGNPAAYLRPVPPGGVVYGSGDDAVVLSREEAARLRSWSMQQYSTLKGQLLAVTGALVTLGTGATFVAAGPELALPFALGGTSSLAYQYLLQRRVDGVAASTAPLDPPPREVQPGAALTLSLALSNPAVRAGLMAGGLVASLMLIHMLAGHGGAPGDVLTATSSGGQGEGDPQVMPAAVAEARQVAAGLAGFLMQKVALIFVTVVSPQDGDGVAAADASGNRRRVDDRVE